MFNRSINSTTTTSAAGTVAPRGRRFARVAAAAVLAVGLAGAGAPAGAVSSPAPMPLDELAQPQQDPNPCHPLLANCDIEDVPGVDDECHPLLASCDFGPGGSGPGDGGEGGEDDPEEELEGERGGDDHDDPQRSGTPTSVPADRPVVATPTFTG